jgi:HTH-type transcriptional regulator / antitoxin MqsA
MKCPACGAAELVRDTRDMSYIYKGEETIIPSVSGGWCPACGGSLLEPEESARVMAAMQLSL